MRIAEVAERGERVVREVERRVVGKREALELILAAIVAGGHVLLEDVPGVAKTLIARSFADVIGLRFGRLQFTPDLLPADVTGASLLDPETGRPIFAPGPVFCNLLLADEINRAPAKTQSALLEAMQEGQVTVEGRTRRLDEPFLVIATENPIDAEGTYPLPGAELDRFLLRTSIGYPDADQERELVRRRAARATEQVAVERVLAGPELREMQAALQQVVVSEPVLTYLVELVAATRRSPRLRLGSSPRGSLALLSLARARAALVGRDFVLPDDVKAVGVPALAHRVVLRPELWVQRFRDTDAIQEILEQVPAPAGVRA